MFCLSCSSWSINSLILKCLPKSWNSLSNLSKIRSNRQSVTEVYLLVTARNSQVENGAVGAPGRRAGGAVLSGEITEGSRGLSARLPGRPRFDPNSLWMVITWEKVPIISLKFSEVQCPRRSARLGLDTDTQMQPGADTYILYICSTFTHVLMLKWHRLIIPKPLHFLLIHSWIPSV